MNKPNRLYSILFFTACLFIIIFEFCRVYFIMPMPGSQKADTLEFAYFVHSYRIEIRTVLFLCLIFGFFKCIKSYKYLVLFSASVVAALFWLFNFKMSADQMFRQPIKLKYALQDGNKVELDRIVLGFSHGDKAKAWPIQYLAYHHQILDSVDGIQLMVTYCSVCRSGRIFSPVINGKKETFRLVGMDHFNAMFEDGSTGSWWRQVNGVCVAGPRKGEKLQELMCSQVTLRDWLALHPNSKIMQPDPAFVKDYEDLKGYDEGKIKSSLEGTDSGSWKEKSWVVGVVIGNQSKAYDWNELKQKRIILDSFNGKRLIIWISNDNRSHFVWAFPGNQPYKENRWMVTADNSVSGWEGLRLSTNGKLSFNIPGQPEISFEPVHHYQEFWHSWRTFHPETETMPPLRKSD